MEEMVLEMIRYLQNWALWRGVTILAEGKAYEYSEDTGDIYKGLRYVKVSEDENQYKGTAEYCDDTLESEEVWPQHLFEVIYEEGGFLYMLINEDVYNPCVADLGVEAWKEIYEKTDIIADYILSKYDFYSPETMLAHIVTGKESGNEEFALWDPMEFDTWEDYIQVLIGIESEVLLQNDEYKNKQKNKGNITILTVEDIMPLWDLFVEKEIKEYIEEGEYDYFRDDKAEFNHIADDVIEGFCKIIYKYGMDYVTEDECTLFGYRK